MLDAAQNAFLIIVCLVCSLFCMATINRYWPAEKRRTHNDLIGWQLSVLGTTYAVIIGFMLYAVWVNFETAEMNANAEANAVVKLYQLAAGLPADSGAKLKALARSYCDAVVESEWKEMDANISPKETLQITKQMWSALTASRATSPSERTAEDHALSELGSLTDYRRIRLIEMASQLPSILWFVLLVGAAVTIASTWMFGAENWKLHALHVSALTILIVLVLAAIADINRPFQGSVHVSDYAFRQAQISLKGD